VGKTLIIAEKPSVARDIAQALPEPLQKQGNTHLEGDNWIVSWAVGHLIRLANPDEYKKEWKYWKMEDLPLAPEQFKLKPASPKTSSQLKALKALMNREDVAGVVNACDAGREGELIFRYIAQYVKLKKPTKRLWLASLTPESIQKGLKELKPGEEYDRLSDAAKGRSEADWLVGMNASRAATLVLRDWLGGAASMGRVQTPTLALLVNRELEIQNFQPEDYWTLSAQFTTKDDGERGERGAYQGNYKDGFRLKTQEEAEKILANVTGQDGKITKLDCQEVNEKQPQLYDLTSLQREASGAFGWTAAHTLGVAQSLYEQHKLLTYPRTDSRWLPAAEGEKLEDLLKQVAKLEPYRPYCEDLLSRPLPLKQVVNDSKVSDHFAIIPTGKVPSSNLPADEKRLYDMVARRLISALGEICIAERTRVETTVSGEYVFVTKGRAIKKEGWRSVYVPVAWIKNDQTILPVLKQDEEVNVSNSEVAARQTKPPKRLNDASLLGMMETAGKFVDDDDAREAMKEGGLGTPATRAATIERLIQVGYASRDKRAIIPTQKGIQLIQLLGEHPLASPQLTGEWEHQLSLIAAGQAQHVQFIQQIKSFCTEIVQDMQNLPEQLKDIPKLPEDQRGNIKRSPAKPLGEDIKCPGCGKPVMDGKKSWSCWQPGDPGCGTAIWKTVAGLKLSKEVALELLGPEHCTKQVLQGFTSKKGSKFAARLELIRVESGKWGTKFIFEDNKPTSAQTESAQN